MNRRDIELLSGYLDGELKPSDSTKLELRLKIEPELASVLNDLRATRSLLRQLPLRKAPRNFTVTRKMVGQNPPLPRTYPVFRWATAVATLLFFVSIGINSFSSQMASQGVAFGVGGGGGSDTELFAEQAPAMEEPAAPAPVEPETPADAYSTEEPSAALSVPQPEEVAPTEEGMRTMETPSDKAGAAENAFGEEQRDILSPVVSSSWQLGFVIVAAIGLLLMVIMRQLSASRWK
jgi:anti-sigma factor RsiW